MTLTHRQADVIGLLARGLTKAETGRLLGISESTVTEHSRRARQTLRARNTAQAVAVALREGLITP